MEKYTIELTEEQLKRISDACETVSRLMSGQLHELKDVLVEVSKLTNKAYDYDKGEALIHSLKTIVGLDQNESIGIRQSGQEARELYEIYYTIKHFFALKDDLKVNVYKSELLEVTDKPKIIVIEGSKHEKELADLELKWKRTAYAALKDTFEDILKISTTEELTEVQSDIREFMEELKKEYPEVLESLENN